MPDTKKRGRPKKNIENENKSKLNSTKNTDKDKEQTESKISKNSVGDDVQSKKGNKKKRGRPSKNDDNMK